MRILKFGGTSVATAERRRRVAEIVRRAAARGPVAVVTSALAGVTDLLERGLEVAVAGGDPAAVLRELEARHLGGAPASAPTSRDRLAELGRLLSGVASLGECPAAVRHRVLACGERLALPRVVAALRDAALDARGVDASELLVAPHGPGEPRPRLAVAASRRRVRRFWRRRPPCEIAVVTGFVAGDGRGGTTTLGRGASDLTATLLGRFLDALAVEIWSDVDGVLSAPPDLVPSAFPLARLDYGEAAALACYGARVLHPEALAPVAEAGIPVWVRNTLRPGSPGTRIGGIPPRSPLCRRGEAEPLPDPAATSRLRAVAAVRDACSLGLRAAWPVHDLASRAFRLLESLAVQPLVVERSDSGRRLDLVLPAAEAARFERASEAALAGGGVTWSRRGGLAAVAAVGPADPWIAAAISRVLRDARVPLLSISSTAVLPGTCAVATIPADLGGRAVRALHDALVRRRAEDLRELTLAVAHRPAAAPRRPTADLMTDASPGIALPEHTY